MASAEDIRFLNVSTNCKQISGRLEAGQLNDNWNNLIDSAMLGDIDLIKIYDENTIVYINDTNITNADDVMTFVSPETVNPFVGLVTVELHGIARDEETEINYDQNADNPPNYNDADSTLIRKLYTIAPCQIDCCLANLIDSAIECHCHCDKCKEDLIRGEKVFLMLQGALFAAEQEENPEHADAMYKKASQLCVEVCACGC